MRVRHTLASMLMPSLSVTAIGLVIGAVWHLFRQVDHALWRGFFGAWAGFATAGLIGLILDVSTGTGHWVPLLGHIGAGAGALAGQQLDLATEESRAGP